MLFFVAKDFIRNLMCKDVKKRYTCKKALAHSWYVLLTFSFVYSVTMFSHLGSYSFREDRCTNT